MKKNYIKLLLFFALLGCLGCSSKHISENELFLRCSETSRNTMVETESGYFIGMYGMLYYADKDNLSEWVEVCNRPNCMHYDYTCNAYLPSGEQFVQKDGKFYSVMSDSTWKMFVYEIATDGNGIKKVYEVPVEKGIKVNGFEKAMFQDKFIIKYSYLDEKGETQRKIICLEEDENGEVVQHMLYEGTEYSLMLSGNYYWSIRGENLLINSLFAEEGEDVFQTLCEIEGDEIKRLNIPEHVSIIGGYYAKNEFTYYQPQEGFYQIDTNSGKEQLICENQIEDARGYVLSEDYMVECNRYIDYKPEQAQLKIYYKNESEDVTLPEEITNSDEPFYPLALASDRMLFAHNLVEKNTCYLYYVMLDDETPELIFGGEIAKNVYIEEESSLANETEEESSLTDTEMLQDAVVFDNEHYFLKVTDLYEDKRNRYIVEMYYENKDDVDYEVKGNFCAINGLQCNTSWGETMFAEETGTLQLIFEKSMLKSYKISEQYQADSYTDIEIGFRVSKTIGWDIEIMEEKIMNFYPKGKENAILFEKIPEDTDQVLIDNSYVTAIVTGYDQQFVPNDTINVLLINKTDQYMMFQVEESAVNGISVEQSSEGEYRVIVNPGKSCILPMTLFDGVVDPIFGGSPSDSFLQSNLVTSIEQLEFRFRAYPCGYSREALGEDFVNERIQLIP